MVMKKRREKIWVVGYFEVRRHSRVLYIPLDRVTVGIHDIRKGDILKVYVVELIRAPRDEEESGGETS